MARYTGPKRRLSRREGLALFAKDAKALEKKGAVPPGQHGLGRRRRISEYGVQLREKQKAKRFFGILEKQFKRYFVEASKVRGATGLALLQTLETRLDNVVYRLNFAKSRAGARQMVSHGHIKIDGKKVNIPSYKVSVNQTIEITSQMRDNTQVKKSLDEESTLPEWLERKATVGRVLRMPGREEMEQSIDEQLIVEYYSR
ncbi:30S ribosomal protein S4 [Candidatus Daviesbacteria bacterium RIFCSPLOWO2_02_FULL_41_8]|uniref:Small ribosomal subunit protein uS4 n=2 Tax=Candidatus Daviesiibacteriota TaxID=1752718 RepID=A0A1F5NMD7_9BACT|nr:MAG: 30S ribosomal protein S4 [Candidatus Daviesbacteria bacterium RIFCSPHIGHO2_01_FULL_41_23]OGE62150.1 MAG: 30S ribosomal protein S4 [Candidatus Daviesbacteria bacterium RIFCSPLOWO2_01_FULL_41_32]OGE78530.1 MAG: 30S ribosomal protein S4 [Candidatus Daviesbacteria bacterium RIFCSPLOWO2_02_FULL_41_8]